MITTLMLQKGDTVITVTPFFKPLFGKAQTHVEWTLFSPETGMVQGEVQKDERSESKEWIIENEMQVFVHNEAIFVIEYSDIKPVRILYVEDPTPGNWRVISSNTVPVWKVNNTLTKKKNSRIPVFLRRGEHSLQVLFLQSGKQLVHHQSCFAIP